MCLDLAARTNNNEIIQVFGGSYAKKQSFALFHSPDNKHCAPHSSLSSSGTLPTPARGAGEIIRSSHIHLSAGANAPTRVLAELHVCGADAVVIQTEGEVAAAGRLRL